MSTALGSGNVDTIADFQVGVDDILLARSVFAAIGTSLSADEFLVGNGALDANDFLILDTTTGRLSYDADGFGSGAAVHFATLTAG